MKALIFVEYPEMSVVKDALQRQFVDFEIIVLKPSENTLYSEANTLVKIVSDNEGVPVFVFISQPLFLAIVSAKLSRIGRIQGIHYDF